MNLFAPQIPNVRMFKRRPQIEKLEKTNKEHEVEKIVHLSA